MQARLIFRIGWKPEIWAKYTSLQNVGLLEKKPLAPIHVAGFSNPRGLQLQDVGPDPLG